MKQKKYRYRKTTPEKLKIMKSLEESGFSYKKIGELMQIASSTVQYWLSPREHKRRKKYSLNYNSKMPKKKLKEKIKNRYKYSKKYIMERYNNDKEFHDRFLKNVRQSQKRIYHKRATKNLCVNCGGKKEDNKHKTCRECRLKCSIWDKAKRIRRKNSGLCVSCGREKESTKFKLCEKCREKERKRRNNWAKAGRCYSCGRPNDRIGIAINCSKCKEKTYFYQRKYLLNKGKLVFFIK